MKNKAVVLGTNYYIGLSIVRCLGKNGVHVVSVDNSTKGVYGSKSKYISERLIAPHYKEDPKGFISFLVEYSKNQEVMPVLFPSADQYVEIIDEYMNDLRPYYLFPENEKGLCINLMNKESIHSMSEKLGVLVPETVRTSDLDFEKKVCEEIGFPCLVKPTDSPAFVEKFRKKLFIVNDVLEMNDAIKKANLLGLEVIVQRIIPGFDDHMHTFDGYMDKNSNITHWLTCQKYRQYPINYGASVYTGQKYIPELYEISSRFFKGVNYKGFAEIEFKKDEKNGKFYLIEANIRTTNLNAMLCKAGINMPFVTYCDMIGEPLPPCAITKDTGYVFWYAYEDILAIKGYLKTKQLTIGEVLKSFAKKKVYSIWEWTDPKPGLSFLGMKLGRVVSKLTGGK